MPKDSLISLTIQAQIPWIADCRCLRGFIRHDGVTYKQAARAAGESSWRSGLRLLQEGLATHAASNVMCRYLWYENKI